MGEARLREDPGLEDLVGKIVQRADPVEVWLFGSRARGDHHNDSDYDLLILVDDWWPDEKVNLVEAFRLVEDRTVPVDAVMLRRGRFEERKKLIGTLSHEIACEGKLLYARPGAGTLA
jgi:predicted nucleotidyltransferase